MLLVHVRRQGEDGRDALVLDRTLTAADCSRAEREPNLGLALMRHQRTLQCTLPEESVLSEGRQPCACRMAVTA